MQLEMSLFATRFILDTFSRYNQDDVAILCEIQRSIKITKPK